MHIVIGNYITKCLKVEIIYIHMHVKIKKKYVCRCVWNEKRIYYPLIKSGEVELNKRRREEHASAELLGLV